MIIDRKTTMKQLKYTERFDLSEKEKDIVNTIINTIKENIKKCGRYAILLYLVYIHKIKYKLVCCIIE